MQCTKPIKAWYGEKNNSGKRGLVFKRPATSPNKLGDLEIPCGRCIDCRLEYSRQWAIRCVHESKLHQSSCFVTLTYDQQNLPVNGTLVKKDLQLFFKRLRKRIYPRKIRYYACGEYGERNCRPHYHCIIFGYCPNDGVIQERNSKGDLFVSNELNEVWKNGTTIYGACTFESAAYCARYATKKVTGERANSHYKRLDPETGEIVYLLPEFACMSLGKKSDPKPEFRSGIGVGWYEKFAGDYYPSDEVIIRGEKSKPPKAYDRKLEQSNLEMYEKIKNARIKKAKEKKEAMVERNRRLAAHEKITRAKMSLRKRSIE